MNNCNCRFSLWDILKDKITGLTGTVMGISFYTTGCVHYGILPKKLKTDGTPHDWQWIDESRMSLVKSKKVKIKEKRGGPSVNPPMM